MTAHEKYYLPNKDNLLQLIQMQLSKKQKTILNVLQPIRHLHQIFNILNLKITLLIIR